MVEELKLAIKVDDDAIEQSLLKQFANAEKMANKVVLTFNNIDLDDKAIEAKFKEMQKMAGKNPIDLSIDKSSIEMLSAISKQLGNIFDIAKGKSIIDSSATVADVNRITQSTNQQVKAVEKITSSYKNQAYELASILKMLAKFDKYYEVPYADAMSKAIKSDAKSYKNGNAIQFAPKKYGMDEDSLKYLRGLSVNLSGAFNYTDTLGLDTANINNLEILIKYFRELLKEKLEFNNIKLNTSDTEELIKALGILKKDHFDDDTKSGRNVYDGYLDKYSDLPTIIQYLKQQEKQAIATTQAEQKLADVEKEVGSSSVSESQNKIQEELKETQKQAEQTSEALSKIGDGDKSNIPSRIEDVFQGGKIQETVNSARELDRTLSDVEIPKENFDDVIAKFNIIEEKAKNIAKIVRSDIQNADGTYNTSYNIKYKDGSNEILGENSNPQKLRSQNVLYNVKQVEQEAKALNQAWEEANKVNNALNETKNTLSSLPRMTELDTQFSSLDAKLSSLNSELTSGKISVADYKKEVKSLTSEYSKLVTIQQNRDVETYEQNAKAAEQEAKAIERMNNELKSYNNQVPKKPVDGQRSDYFEGFVQKYKNAIDEAQKYLDNLGDSPVTEEVKRKWEDLIKEIKKAKKEMDAVPNADRGSDSLSRRKEIDTITKYLQKFTGISKQAKQELKGLIDQLQSDDPSTNVKKIHDRFLELTASEREAGREAKSFFDIFKSKVVHRFASQLAMYYLSFYDFIRYTRNAINAVKELDTALIDLKKTTTMSSSELERFYYDSNEVAKKMGVTTKEIIEQASAWSRFNKIDPLYSNVY